MASSAYVRACPWIRQGSEDSHVSTRDRSHPAPLLGMNLGEPTKNSVPLTCGQDTRAHRYRTPQYQVETSPSSCSTGAFRGRLRRPVAGLLVVSPGTRLRLHRQPAAERAAFREPTLRAIDDELPARQDRLISTRPLQLG
jgi:hypothetical protein